MKRLRFDGMTEQSERDEIRRMRWRFKHKDSAARCGATGRRQRSLMIKSLRSCCSMAATWINDDAGARTPSCTGAECAATQKERD